MRILYVIPSEGFGGAERQAIYHASRLPRFGVEVVPLVGPGRLIVEQLAREGIRHVEFSAGLLRDYGRPGHPLDYARHVAATLRKLFGAVKLIGGAIRRHEIDVVFASRAAGVAMVGPAARLLRLPQVWRVGSRPTRPLHRALMRVYAALFRPDAIVCNCHAVRNEIQPLVNVPCRVVYNGVDLERFSRTRVEPTLFRELGLEHGGAVTLGITARPAPGKGLETVSAALKRLALSPGRLRAVVAGDYGWRSHYERAFAAAGLESQVTYIGHVQAVERFLRCCDIALVPSNRDAPEGLPNALLEAMAMECAVVGTAVSGIEEALAGGEAGLLIPPDDPDALAAAVRRLVDSAALRARFGRAARAAAARRFSLDAAVGQLAEALQALDRSLSAERQAKPAGERARAGLRQAPQALGEK
jgi:glycosyltransferase involved in cell wall biosynthesis